MTDWVIERGVLIPPKDSSKKTGVKGTPTALATAFSEMKVRESLFTTVIDRYSVNTAYNSAARTHGHHFISRAMDGGVRVWRMK